MGANCDRKYWQKFRSVSAAHGLEGATREREQVSSSEDVLFHWERSFSWSIKDKIDDSVALSGGEPDPRSSFCDGLNTHARGGSYPSQVNLSLIHLRLFRIRINQLAKVEPNTLDMLVSSRRISSCGS